MSATTSPLSSTSACRPGACSNTISTQLPQILVTLLPVALLLALLFSLGRMSRSNEIVSMLTAGVSIPPCYCPLICAGVLTAIGGTVLNYSLAPHAELARRTFLEDPGEGRQARGISGQIFRNRTDNRTWFIQHFSAGAERIHHRAGSCNRMSGIISSEIHRDRARALPPGNQRPGT